MSPAKAFVSVYAGLGDRNHAFEWLEKAYQDHDPMLAWMRVVPLCDQLRGEPRFDEKLRRVGLECD